MTVQFAVGVAIVGIGAILYQIVSLLTGVGDLWSLLPGLTVLALAFATFQTGSSWPAVVGLIVSLPLIGLSIFGALVQISDPSLSGYAVFGYFGSVATLLTGLAYAAYAAGRAMIDPWLSGSGPT